MEAHGNGIESSVEVELRSLSIYTHHGVSDAEQEIGQRLEFDVSFDVPDCDAVLTDRLEDTVDYGEVCDIVALAATERSYRTLERLAQVVGERLIERYGCDSVRVRAAKPEPPLPLAIQEVAVEVVQERTAGRGRRRGRVAGCGPATSASAPTSATARPTCGPRSRRSPGAGSRSRRSPRLRDRAGRRGPRPAGLPQRRRPDPHRSRARGPARPLQGRSRSSAAGSSTLRATAPGPLDVDLLLLGDLELTTERLTLPHREVTSRRFVLVPAARARPGPRAPDGTDLAGVLAELGGGERVVRVGPL